MTKVDIISGFLGAGKTTLIKKLIAECFKGKQVVLIENEFGEIGIDGGFLKDAGINITEMNSGCICCSLVGDFGAALTEVVEKYHPDRIIIEPSGVGKLSDVAKAVQRIDDSVGLVINALVTVVDGTKIKMYMKNFGEFYNNQIESAGTIVISRTQKLDEKKLDEVIAMLREHNKETEIVTTPWDSISGDKLISVIEKSETLESMIASLEAEPDEEEHEHHHHHHHDHDHEHEEHDEHEHHHHHDHEHDHEHEEHDEHEHHHHHDHDHDHEHEEHDEHEHHHHHEHDHDHDEHEEHEHHHHHGHDADEVFQSWGVETAHKFAEEDIKSILEKLEDSDKYGVVLRAKGYVADSASDRWLHFDMTPGEYEIREGAAEVTGRICVIGSGIKEDAVKELWL
ncbi:MAG: GTP-binding protein [Lachnospiraceae bacterium]|nr:GTP-binding protein [Lachnospiraceae bacterium]